MYNDNNIMSKISCKQTLKRDLSTEYLASPYRQNPHTFFFQADDGIRHPLVTGVQTCALPISRSTSWPARVFSQAIQRPCTSSREWSSTSRNSLARLEPATRGCGTNGPTSTSPIQRSLGRSAW